MITQSQYFDIEEYLEKECRIIEPKLLEELIDHFRDSIATKMQSEDDFLRAFEGAKVDFGGVEGATKIQRNYQWYAIKFHLRGTLQEFKSFFKKPYLPRTLAFCLVVSVFILHYNLRFFGWGESNFWDGGLTAGLAMPFLIIPLYMIQQKFDTGHFSLEARYWASSILTLLVSLPFSLCSALMNFVSDPYAQIITLVYAIFGSLLYLAYALYAQRKLFPEYGWL